MANVQWVDIPFELDTPGGGTILLNQHLIGPGPGWILDQDNCRAGSAKRVARDNTPQHPGEIVHRKFKAGFVMQLSAYAAELIGSGPDMQPVCGSDLVDLFDALMRALDNIENNDGQLKWTPTSHAQRMLDACRWLGPDGVASATFTSVQVEIDEEVFTKVQFAVLSPFPYAQDAAQTTTPLGGSIPVVVDNTGTTKYFPVVKVFGPTDNFTLENVTTGEKIIYSSDLPDASAVASGHYIEFDFFRNTAYLDGSGANMKPGIDVLNSDFWGIEVGNNTVEIFGASADMLWAPAYA